MATVLLEIGCEELPAAACRDAERQLPGLVERELGTAPEAVYVGPRRLAVLVRDLAERTPDEWVKGPPVALRERAAAGFARKQGVAPEDLEERDGFLGVVRPGRALAEVLPERLDAVVRGLSFRKTMRWDESGLRWPRPVRWRLAKLGGDTVTGFDGTSWGHRFTHGEVQIGDAESYLDALRAADVEPDQGERRRRIVAGLDALGAWSDPAGKLEEVVHLAEWPTVVLGAFDERFLELPERVVVTTMQSHQRYFPLGGARFAVVINGGDPEVARRGHEQVLEARLQDASFTFERDVAKGIEGLAGELGSITFAARAGTYADKTERLARLVSELGGDEHAVQAARLAKADQAAELVREFPDLEGHIGSVYARLAGLPEEVCAAIEEQYLPDAADAPLPITPAGRALAAAEKLDNLAVNFALGNQPTGSRDPFGLRRAAIGLCRLAAEADMHLDLRLAQVSEQMLGEGHGRERVVADLPQFVQDRMESVLDVPVEIARAARAADLYELRQTARLARALAALDDPTMDALHTAYTRSTRLSPSRSDFDDADVYERETRLDRDALSDPSEVELAAALNEADIAIGRGFDADDLDSAFAAGASLAPVLDRFFEDVLVMADDPEVRRNRRALLHHVSRALGRLGDFSQIPR